METISASSITHPELSTIATNLLTSLPPKKFLLLYHFSSVEDVSILLKTPTNWNNLIVPGQEPTEQEIRDFVNECIIFSTDPDAFITYPYLHFSIFEQLALIAKMTPPTNLTKIIL